MQKRAQMRRWEVMKYKKIGIAISILLICITIYLIYSSNDKGNIEWSYITSNETLADISSSGIKDFNFTDTEERSFQVVQMQNGAGAVFIESPSSEWVDRIDNQNGITTVLLKDVETPSQWGIGPNYHMIKIDKLEKNVRVVHKDGYVYTNIETKD